MVILLLSIALEANRRSYFYSMDMCKVCLGRGKVINRMNTSAAHGEVITCPVCDGIGVVWNYRDALKVFKYKLLYSHLRHYSLIMYTVDKQQVSYMWIDYHGRLVVEHRVGSESEVMFL